MRTRLAASLDDCFDTGCPRNNLTKKIEYLRYGSSKRADFFTSDRGMYQVYIYKDMSMEILC